MNETEGDKHWRTMPASKDRSRDTSPAGYGLKVADLLQDEVVDLHVGYEKGTPLSVNPEEA